MTKNTALVERFFALLEAGDADGLMTLLDDDFVFRDPDSTFVLPRASMPAMLGWDIVARGRPVVSDLRVSYRFEVLESAGDGTTVETLDPLNRRVYRPDRDALRASLLELPGAPSQPWHERTEELGTWRQFKVADGRGIRSHVLGIHRRPQRPQLAGRSRAGVDNSIGSARTS